MKVEAIANEDELFFHVHANNITHKTRDKKPMPKEAAMGNTPTIGTNKSCDWSALTTPEGTREILSRQFRGDTTDLKNMHHFFVFAHYALDWRSLEHHDFPKQVVNHDPLVNSPEIPGKPNNEAHAIIVGEKPEKLRVRMARKARWKISPPDSKIEMQDYRRRHGLIK